LYGFKGFKGISYFINEGNLEFDLVSWDFEISVIALLVLC
jgi:hypothetical protein